MAKKLLFKRKDATGKINPTPKVSNSGKLVYEILDKKEREENLSDFSDFPRDCCGKIENVCLEQITSCGFNNVVSSFYSRTHLIEEFGIGDISMLSGKYITYAIVTDKGKWYFGHSDDFGQRINTWLKDFRGREMSGDRKSKDKSFNEELCGDARKYKRVLFICLAISDNEWDAIAKEDKLIKEFKYCHFKEVTNGENPLNYSKKEVSDTVSQYIYNIINAIG